MKVRTRRAGDGDARPTAARSLGRAATAPGHVRVTTSNPLFDAIFQQSRRDLRVLSSGEGDEAFVAAGIP